MAKTSVEILDEEVSNLSGQHRNLRQKRMALQAELDKLRARQFTEAQIDRVIAQPNTQATLAMLRQMAEAETLIQPLAQVIGRLIILEQTNQEQASTASLKRDRLAAAGHGR